MKKRTTKIPNPHARKILVGTRLNTAEMQVALNKALKFEGGNVSELVRKAIIAYNPGRESK